MPINVSSPSTLWILAKVAIRFMESLHFLNITFTYLPCGKSTNPGECNFFYIFPLKFLNLVLIPSADLDGHQGTWTGRLCTKTKVLTTCFYFIQNFFCIIFEEKYFCCYILLTDQITISCSFYFALYWVICVSKLFVNQVVTS